MSRFLAGRLEFDWDVISGAEVHLIRRLSSECRMGEARIVLFNIERDEVFDCGDRVERVQVQPLVLQCPPPSLDQGVREADLRESEDSSKQT